MLVSQFFGRFRSLSLCPALVSLSVSAGYLQLVFAILLFTSRSSLPDALLYLTMPLRWSLAAHSSLVAFVFCPVYDVVLLLLLPMSDLLVRLIVFDRLLVSRVFECLYWSCS